MFKTCQFCGKVYKTYDSNRMFCSISCSNNAKIKGNEIKIFNDFANIIVNSKKSGIKEVLIDLDDIEKVKKYTWCLTRSRDMALYAGKLKCFGTYKTLSEAKQVRISAEKEYRPYVKEINKYGT